MTHVASAGAIIAHTVAVAIVLTCPKFTCGGVPTLIAMTHEILQSTANTMTTAILRTYHEAAVITVFDRTESGVALALTVVAVTMRIACGRTLSHRAKLIAPALVANAFEI